MKEKKYPEKQLKPMILYFAIVLAILAVVNVLFLERTTENVTYSKFLDMIESGQVESVIISTDKIEINPINKARHKKYITVPVNDMGLIDRLRAQNVGIEQAVPQQGTAVNFFLTWIVPVAAFYLIWRFIMKDVMNKRGGVMSFGNNKTNGTTIVAVKDTGVTFEDVAGQEEAKESLAEIVDFLHNPEKYQAIGAKLPKGALLVGPPGTGKTLIAKAVAGEAKVPFFSMSGSEFVQMFVGMGAARVRELFKQAQEKSPCIIFIDEVDAIGKSREAQMSTNDEREQTLNQLLTEMDGFDSKRTVVILAATNRPEVLDPALLRPGRFDRRVIVDKPDLKGREAILKVHSKDVTMSNHVDLHQIAKATSGAAGADLANMINEAALLAVKEGRQAVEQKDLEEAIEAVIAGKVKKDRILSHHEKESVAYHEIGHALVAFKLKNTDPVHKITIIPRTKGALGYTMQLPTEEKYLVTAEEMRDQIAVMLGGRAAEEVKFNQISTGAANDIERATEMARRMVTVYGMSERFDMVGLESPKGQYLNGRPVRNCSAETEAEIDAEVLHIIKMQHQRAIDILRMNFNGLEKSSAYLLENETISGEEFANIIDGKPIANENDEEMKDTTN